MEPKGKYMSWIKDYTEATFKLYAGTVVEAFQPLDFFHFYPLWFDLWMKRISEVIDVLDLEEKTFLEVKDILPCPSSLRAQLQKIVPTYNGVEQKNPKDFKKVSNFFARMLEERCVSDPFAKNSNKIHTTEEISSLIKTLPVMEGDPEVARSLGKVITSVGSYGHGLYNDLGIDFCWDAYGPYKLKEKGSLIIRHFLNLSPKDLWPTNYLSSINEILIYSYYNSNVSWTIPYVGCHASPTKGNLLNDLEKYLIVIDGKPADKEQIQAVIEDFSLKAIALYQEIRKMDFEQLKQKVMYQECYQLKSLFDAASLDWKPTVEMIDAIKGKRLLTGLLPLGTIMTNIADYKKIFHLIDFEKEVLNQN